MTKTAVSQFKSKLSAYLKLVRTGEKVEIQDRGVPIAILSGISAAEDDILIVPPRADPRSFAKIRAQVSLKIDIDAVDLLVEDRRKR